MRVKTDTLVAAIDEAVAGLKTEGVAEEVSLARTNGGPASTAEC